MKTPVNILFSIVLLVLCSTGGAEAGTRTVQINIDAPTMAKALIQLTQQSGLQLIFPTDGGMAKLPAPRVVGTYTAEEALEKLLRNTGLKYEYVDVRTIAVRRAGSASATDGRAATAATQLVQVNEASDSESAASTQAGQAPQNVSAATESSDLAINEVIVTATKRQERVQDVPASIAVIGTEDIERRGLVGMQDYLRSIPGVNLVDTGAMDNSIVIRGITTSPVFENFASGPSVARYFGETSLTATGGVGGGGVDLRPVDLERIEVLRGPQGTAFGSAALGGALRMIPAKPRLDEFSGKVSGYFSNTSGEGSENTMMQGIINIPLVANRLAVRAVGYRYDESGFYRNIGANDPSVIAIFDNYGAGYGDLVQGFSQDGAGKMLSTGGRLAALWQATDELDLSLTYLSQSIEQDGVPFANVVGTYDQISAAIVPEGRLRGETGSAADTDLDLASLELNYDFGWSTMTSVVSWLETSSPKALDASIAFGLPISNIHRRNDFSSLSAEARLASNFDGRFQFLGGLFYEKVDENFVHRWLSPGTAAESPFATSPVFARDMTRELEQRASFGEITYDLTDKLTATAGGRYFDYEKGSVELREGGLAGLPPGTSVVQVLQNSEDGSIFKAGLDYKPTPDSLIYASWAEGFRLGRPDAGAPVSVCDTDNDGVVDGTNVQISATRSINSDVTENYEIGGKFTLFDRRAVVDVAIYHINWDGLPVSRELPVAGCPGFIANAGSATSEGAEFQASFSVTEGLTIDFGAGYIKAQLAEDSPGIGNKGDRLPASPRMNANLAAQYEFKVTGHDAFIRADSFYTGSSYGSLIPNPLTRSGDYIRVDARAGVAITNLSVELFVRNLTNEDAVTWGGILSAYRLQPRTIGLQLGYSFE